MKDSPTPVSVREVAQPKRLVATWLARLTQAFVFWQIIAFIGQLIAPDAIVAISRVLNVTNLPTYPSALSVVLLYLLTVGLMRHQRAAMWVFIVVFQLPLIIFAIFIAVDPEVDPDLIWREDPLTYGAIAFALVICPVLIWARAAFFAKLAPGARLRAITIFITSLGVSFLLAFTVIETTTLGRLPLMDSLAFSADSALGLPSGTLPFGNPVDGPIWAVKLCGFISAAGLLSAIASFFAGRKHSLEADLRDELRIRELLLTSDHPDSLGYFATRDDRSVIFSPSGRAGISYRVVGGIALAGGDPLGKEADWPEAIATWIDHAHSYGRWPAVLAASETGARAYRAAGLHCLSMGDEAVVSTRDFRLNGPAMKPVRRAIARPRTSGYTVKVRRQRDISPAELLDLQVAADLWRHGDDERGFSMASGRLGDGRDARSVIITAHDANGACQGLLSFVPWGRRGLSLDLMRRSPEAVSGVTEFMITSLIEASREMGITHISLNFAMFRTSFVLGERIGATPAQRLVYAALRRASRWWQLESLYRFNQKFLPVWQTRMLCFESTSHLARILVAAGKAEGFLPQWEFWSRLTNPVSRPEGSSNCVHSPSSHNYVSDDGAAPALCQEIHSLENRLLIPSLPAEHLSEQERVRRAKVEKMRVAGLDPYPVAVERSCAITDLLASDPSSSGEQSVVGRIMRIRDHGGVIFADLREDGHECQVMLQTHPAAPFTTHEPATAQEPGAALHTFRAYADRGDLISVSGVMTRSRSGEPTLEVTRWAMAAKCVTPPPDKYYGLADPQMRLRAKHVDVAISASARERLLARSRAVAALRSTLAGEDFTEVETPILQTVHGGANARPFTTFINAYDMPLSLRIAPELYLKRLAIGGVQRVFEIGRNFRNEGADATHNPEFTSLEAYAAHGDYHSIADLTQRLILAAAHAVHGEPRAIGRNGRMIDLSGPWQRITVHQAVSQAIGRAPDAPLSADTPAEELAQICRAHGIAAPADATAGALITELYEELVEPGTTAPTFYFDFPVETSPLTRPHRRDPRLAERWDLVADGMELGTAYSELTDPLEQRQRFYLQSLLAAAGDAEAMEVDEDFLRALDFGMVPTGGLGLGVDRLVMFLLGTSIRETLAFPFLRPQ